MARINAGSTLVQQYAPPFVVSDSIANGWTLQWNSTLQAFEAVDPDANVVEGGFSNIYSSVFLGTRQQVFVVPWAADSKQSLLITIDGVKQNQTAYTVSVDTASNTTTVTLDEDLSDIIAFPDPAPNVEILGLQAEGGAQVLVYQETAENPADDTQVLFPASGSIGWYPPSRESLIITIDGIKQAPNTYFIVPNANFTGAQVQFVSPPAASSTVEIEILGITTTGETIASPVDVVNLGTGGSELFKEKTVSGDQQILNFRSLIAGNNVTLASAGSDTLVQISASEPVFTANLTVSGGTGIATVDTGADPTEVGFRGLNGGNGIVITANATDVTIARDGTYSTNAGPTIDIATNSPTDRVVGVTGAGAISVQLPDTSGFYNGEMITVKREDGNTGTITINIDNGGTIDGAGTYQITSAIGYVTLYSNGTQFLIVSTSE